MSVFVRVYHIDYDEYTVTFQIDIKRKGMFLVDQKCALCDLQLQIETADLLFYWNYTLSLEVRQTGACRK